MHVNASLLSPAMLRLTLPPREHILLRPSFSLVETYLAADGRFVSER